ncbi:ABC transporter ATP-binding protein [Asinibacterium sp. OR53]|uniref:ABC transporter ATP-binding protein n=1 Tax=Asinibacterium sp. OR53 TaxID=925409 RepID=UPI000478817A|nr:ABC transporter ATP-binding protein [Asinibacterium sp. OR53]
MHQPLLQINDLSIDFSSDGLVTQALQHISLTVARGEILAIVGESGSGKSVTSLSILQLLPAPPALYRSGEILFSHDGHTRDILRLSPPELQALRGRHIAMIFQEPMTSLNPLLTCGFQVMEAIREHFSLSAAEAREKTIALFEEVQLPDPAALFDRYPHQLSGGQKQRVMIAMAMSCDPALLICDEPTTALDVTVQQSILLLIRRLQQRNNMGVIFITHDFGVVSAIADRVAVMYKGQLVEQNTTANLLKAPQHPYTKALLACRPALYSKGERLPVVSDFMEGTSQPAHPSTNTSQLTTNNAQLTTLLKVSNLSVHYPGKKNFLGRVSTYNKAVDNVSFEVYEGETLGLVGESGCGKSTLGRALLRLIDVSNGSLHYKGEDLLAARGSKLKHLRRELQIVFQDPYSSLNPRITIGEAIAEPLLVHGLVPSSKERKERVIDLLEKVGLQPSHYNRYPHEFSGGQRQRIVIARALALNPRFVVCDESVSALDVSVQAQVLNLLNDLKKTFGFTAVFISHDLSVVRYISDRIMVMNKGRIEEYGPAEQVYHQPQSAYTQRLIASIPR